MKRLLLLVFAVVLSLSATVFGQARFAGKVVDVVDGRTVILDTNTGKVTAQLQYVATPEPEQQLHGVAREHLSRLAVGKLVEFQPVRILDRLTVGRMTMGGVDLSLQMIRDGAAWHEPLVTSGQEQSEFNAYAAIEAAAKHEKRGIWSVPGLKPAWQYRAEKLESQKRQELAERPGRQARTAANKKTKSSYWGDPNPAIGNVGALFNGYNVATRTGYVATPMMGVEQSDEDKQNDRRTAVEIAYWYREDEQRGRTGRFIITVISNWWRFPKDNDLVILGEKPWVIGKANRTFGKSNDTAWEKLTYEVQRSAIDRLANENVNLKINRYILYPKSFAYSIIYNMLQVSGPNQLARKSKSNQ
jgi:endonuclease YncB( thermonuclease family)